MKKLTPSPVLLAVASLTLVSFAWAQTGATQRTPGTLPNAPQPAPQANPAAPAAVAPAMPAAPAAAGSHLLPSPDANATTAGTLATSLGGSNVVNAIQQQEFPKREQLLNELQDRIQTADRRIAELNQKASQLSGSDRQSVQAAMNDYQRNKTRLEQTLQNARSVNSTTWERVRASIATDYAFFVSSAAGVELAVPN